MLVAVLAFRVASAAEPASFNSESADLAAAGTQFLATYCKACHGDDYSYPGLDVTDRLTLLHPADSDEDPFIVDGNAKKSRLFHQVTTQRMPPEDQPQPTADEIAVFKQWIEAGAPFPAEKRIERPFVGEETILELIADDLDSRRDDELRYVRYFSLAHLWNDTTSDEPITEEDLRLTRAAVSKLVNSLSNRSRIVRPRIVDPEFATLLAIDIRDYGWDQWHWNEVLKGYPYGLKLNSHAATRIYRATQTRLPYIRADWFCANASRPPLYHTLLRIPNNAKPLEASLGVDIRENFLNGQLTRSAFQKSGVSQQNRMVERHDMTKASGYYWKSYDMKPGTGEEGDFSRRPLGPHFERSIGRQPAAFTHDGGEIIWSLPNGLQAYMLVTGEDVRIDQGPPDVVYDPNQHGGTFLITNGISCMGCHRRGMITLPGDEIRELYSSRTGQVVADRVLALYPERAAMSQLIKADSKRFLAAVDEATGVFLQQGDDRDKEIADFPEPVTKVARRYLRDIDSETVIREMGLNGKDENGDSAASSFHALAKLATFRVLGLANLANGRSVSRETWERAYGRVCRELQLGVPIVH